MATAKKDPQAGAFDRTIESPELEAAVDLIVSWREEHGDELKEVAHARATIKAVTEQYALQDGERLRVGRFVITGKLRSGGGFEVPSWSKVVPGEIEEA